MKEKLILLGFFFSVLISFSQTKDSLLFEESETLIENKKYKEAILNLNKFLETNPNHIGAYINKGISNNGLKNYVKAIQNFNEAIKIDSTNTLAYFLIAKNYNTLNELKKSLEYYNYAEETVKNKVFNTSNLVLKRTFINAMYPFKVPISKINFEKGLVYFNLKNYKAAFNNLNNINEEERDKESQYLLAITLKKLKQNKKACIELKKAILLGSIKAKKNKNDFCT